MQSWFFFEFHEKKSQQSRTAAPKKNKNRNYMTLQESKKDNIHPTECFLTVELKHYRITEKIIGTGHKFEQSMFNIAEVEEILKEDVFTFMVIAQGLVNKTLMDPKFLTLKVSIGKN